jgi:hypothetical protein
MSGERPPLLCFSFPALLSRAALDDRAQHHRPPAAQSMFHPRGRASSGESLDRDRQRARPCRCSAVQPIVQPANPLARVARHQGHQGRDSGRRTGREGCLGETQNVDGRHFREDDLRIGRGQGAAAAGVEVVSRGSGTGRNQAGMLVRLNEGRNDCESWPMESLGEGVLDRQAMAGSPSPVLEERTSVGRQDQTQHYREMAEAWKGKVYRRICRVC